MLTFCRVTLSMVIKPSRQSEPTESLSASARPASRRSVLAILAVSARRPARGPPALPSRRSMQTQLSTFTGGIQSC
jgi:hypothetical protein